MEKIVTYMFVALGAALGGVVRFGTGEILKKYLGAGFPYATLLVNVLGSFLAAAVVFLLAKKINISPAFNLFLTVGFCGGFTTFSTFSVETLAMFQQGNVVTAFTSILLNVFLSLLAAGFALYLSNFNF